MTGVRLNLLGGFGLRVDGQEGPPLPRKTRALLAVLAVDRGRPMARERVAELLWPNSGPKQIQGSLREALYSLRRPLRGRQVVVSHDGALALGQDVATDVEEFERQALAEDLAGLHRAARAYAGPLLAGFPQLDEDFADWLALSRDVLERKALAVLGRIGDLCTATGDAAGALEAAERMFAIDPLREEIHSRLLDACGAAGRRADGLRHYAAIAEMMKRELGINPGAQTREIARRLRAEMDPPVLPEPPRTEPTPVGAPPQIAVLPFAQLGDEAVPSHIADGILVDTVCQLAGLRELQVISHGSSLTYRDPQVDLRQVGRELGARYVVRGSMRRRGNVLRLTTELADARTGAVVWARTHDTSATLDFADQDRLVAQIVNTLAPRVQELELKRIRGQRPDTMTVYEKVLLAREHLVTIERDRFAEAKTLLDQVVQQEPEYADAYALLADWQGVSMNQGWLPYDNGGREETERLARLALALDRDNIRALVLYAHRRAMLHRDYDGARRMFERALDVAPGTAHSWLYSSYPFAYNDDPQEAIRRVQRALDLSPRDRRAHDYYSAMCVAHYAARNFDEAAAWGRRAMAEPGVWVATMRWTAASLAAAGRHADAREVARGALEIAPAQRVANSMRNSPFSNGARREEYGGHLLAAGFNP